MVGKVINRLQEPFIITNRKVQRLTRIYEEVCKFIRIGSNIEVSDAELFNSGYEGIYFYIKEDKVYIIEQPGVVGTDDHSEGYLKLKVNGDTI